MANRKGRKQWRAVILCSLIAATGCGGADGDAKPGSPPKQASVSYHLVKDSQQYLPCPVMRWSGRYVVGKYAPALKHYRSHEGLLMSFGARSLIASKSVPPGGTSMAFLDQDTVVISPESGKGLIGYRLPDLEEVELPLLPAWRLLPTNIPGMLLLRSLLRSEDHYNLVIYRHADKKIWRFEYKNRGFDPFRVIVTKDRAVVSGQKLLKHGVENTSGDEVVAQLLSLDEKLTLVKEYSRDDQAYGSWQDAVLLGEQCFAVATDFGKYQIADLSTGKLAYVLDTKIPESEFRDGHGQPFRLIGGRWVQQTGRFLGLEHRTGSKTSTLVAYDLRTGRELQRRTGISADIDDVVVCFDGEQWNAMLEVKWKEHQIVSVANLNREVASFDVPSTGSYSLLYTGKRFVIVTPDGFAHLEDLAAAK